jgi:hypothetical protein
VKAGRNEAIKNTVKELLRYPSAIVGLAIIGSCAIVYLRHGHHSL